ncbi:MAG: hypothetical protein IE919_09980 [Thioclava sp.]|nr:hypothetical protein [Thioclava sp.]MBD3803552.1 hypothetical protein [Thioclava sp.]
MSVSERVSEAFYASTIGGLITATFGAVVWFLRVVLTNQREIALLKQSHATLAANAEADREQRDKIDAKMDRLMERLLK